MGRLRANDGGSALAVRYRKLLEAENDYGVNEECLNIVEPQDWRDFLMYSCMHCGTVEKLKVRSNVSGRSSFVVDLLRMKRPCLTPPPAVPIDYEHEDIKYPVT
jgi:hypothetical protein